MKAASPEETAAMETKVEWLRRVTAEARNHMQTYYIPDWVAEQRVAANGTQTVGT